jgi:hypothetical protein
MRCLFNKNKKLIDLILLSLPKEEKSPFVPLIFCKIRPDKFANRIRGLYDTEMPLA